MIHQTFSFAADPTSPDQPVYRLDRRAALRHPVADHVTAIRRSAGPEAAGHPLCALHLRNISATGLAAVCPTDLPVNEKLAIVFPPHGNERGIELTGRVVRCRPVKNIAEHVTDAHRLSGYELAITFDLPAAA